ncbi:unnamed protein product [Prorocentrum cordatum]|uniref:Uncharacterized protein n=1 Tax=Prorocentrum cordatum TaxID=2364126 RepID=A0ABN9TGS1_9DINO|nr:unnamed protein product [Polarella glacialis]
MSEALSAKLQRGMELEQRCAELEQHFEAARSQRVHAEKGAAPGLGRGGGRLREAAGAGGRAEDPGRAGSRPLRAVAGGAVPGAGLQPAAGAPGRRDGRAARARGGGPGGDDAEQRPQGDHLLRELTQQVSLSETRLHAYQINELLGSRHRCEQESSMSRGASFTAGKAGAHRELLPRHGSPVNNSCVETSLEDRDPPGHQLRQRGEQLPEDLRHPEPWGQRRRPEPQRAPRRPGRAAPPRPGRGGLRPRAEPEPGEPQRAGPRRRGGGRRRHRQCQHGAGAAAAQPRAGARAGRHRAELQAPPWRQGRRGRGGVREPPRGRGLPGPLLPPRRGLVPLRHPALQPSSRPLRAARGAAARGGRLGARRGRFRERHGQAPGRARSEGPRGGVLRRRLALTRPGRPCGPVSGATHRA